MQSSVLIVESDRATRSNLVQELRKHEFRVVAVETVDEALDALIKARVVGGTPIDVLLSDLHLHGWDGFDLLRVVPRVSSTTRFVLMSDAATAKEHQAARELGAVCVLCRPFTPAQLITALHTAVESKAGFQAEIHGISLLDMLQMLHLSRRSLSVAVNGTVDGQIHLVDGEIIHAQAGEETGEPALLTLLGIPAGFLKTYSLVPSIEPTISLTFDVLLLKSLQQLDENRGFRP